VENVHAYAEALAGSDKNLFVGDETLLMQTLGAGWTGTISGAANVLPLWLSQIVAEWDLDRESAETKFEIIRPALAAIRKSSQPATNKAMLERAGVLPQAAVRLPLLAVGVDAADAVWEEVGKLMPK
jgi:4-hydroxy-tetrahydrodipicolinate synthase